MEEMFNGEQHLVGGGFPEELTPFPEPQAQAQAQALPSVGLLTAPPQKLRPIRSNGGRNINGSELGFVASKLESAEETEALLKLKSEMDAELLSNFKSQASHLNNVSFSSSSDCSGDSADKSEDPSCSTNPPRPKRRRKKKMQSFLQHLVSQVLQKQEQMHLQLMHLIHIKEQERILREEAWRRQETDRAIRDQQSRAQEAARTLALISFIRNALGVPHIHIPDPLPPLPLPSLFSQEHPAHPHSPALPQHQHQHEHEQHNSDPHNKRWPTSEVQALITLRAALDYKFHTLGVKALVWEEVSAGMAKMGFLRTAKKCKEKWDNINKYYKKATASGNNHSENAKSCPYFHELDTLYRNRIISAAPTHSPTNNHNV